MKMPISWLSDYMTLDVSLKQYMEDLTMSGSKVEAIEFIGEEITNVLTGKITEIERHPDAEKLVVCQIDVAKDEIIQIVTGATNVFVGAIVPVAMHKSTLAGGLKITRGNLRGVKSNGMLCSFNELGLAHSHVPYAIEDGILILPEDTAVGADIRDILGLNDHVVEFEITSNRPDCMSVLGLVRETFATYGKKFDYPAINVTETSEKTEDFISAQVNSDLCNRYMAKVVKNVKVGPSPAWLRHRLSACGIRPINNIVDITNYVLLEYGQPMHAFDYDTLSGKKIIVRNAQAGEKFTTLDDVERELQSSMVVIADAEKTSAIAGIMGGLDSEIKEHTKTLVFECANFDGASIRIASKKLGLRTESSGKFEKGLDAENCEKALARACELITLLECGDVCSGVIDIYNNKKDVKTLPLEVEKMNKFLGTSIEKSRMIEILDTLEFKVQDDVITVPSFRADVESMADIAEEVARIFGYNNIKSTSFAGQTVRGGLTLRQEFEKQIGITMRSFGFNEIITYSFISKKSYEKINLPEEKRVSTVITNPLGEDLSIMRTTTVPSMMDIVLRNINYRNASAKLYEIGTIYEPVVENGVVNADKLPLEKKILTVSSYGSDDFFSFKGYVETALKSLSIENISFVQETQNETYHTGICAKIFSNDTEIGVIGNIHPLVLENYGTNVSILMCEIDVNLMEENRVSQKLYKKLPKFPASTRDIAVVCSNDTPVGELEKCIKKSIPKILEDVKLFDVFVSEKLGLDKKSVAFSIILRKEESTLTDEDCDKAIANVLKNLENDLGAVLRS